MPVTFGYLTEQILIQSVIASGAKSWSTGCCKNKWDYL